MATENILVEYPADVLAEIDKLAGDAGRAAYLIELAKREVLIQRQREALYAAAGSWKDEDHPELAQGSEAWVRSIREVNRRSGD